jgi:hypothetical protein
VIRESEKKSGLAHNLVGVKSTSHRLSQRPSQINSFVWDVAVSETPKPALLYVLAALVLLETAAFAAATIYLVIEIFVGDASYLATGIAYAITVGIVAVLVGVVARAIFRARPWVRGATVCIAVLQGLLGISILVSGQSNAALGWALVVPAVVMLVLVFTPPVLRATVRPDRESRDERDDRTF